MRKTREEIILNILLALGLLLSFSLIYSKFLLSISMILMVLLSIFYRGKKWRWKMSKPMWMVALFFIVVFISGINSENLSSWLHHCRMKLPFIILPLAFTNLPLIPRKHLDLINGFFICLLSFSSFPILFEYLTNFTEVQQALGKGQPMNTPVHHVKFSLFLAYSVFAAGYLTLNRPLSKSIKLGLSMMGVFNLIILHLIAVRTGIFVFYSTLMTYSVYQVIQHRRWKILTIATAITLIVPVLAYHMAPSFFKRYHYMKYDLNKFFKEGASDYSDSDRLVSLSVGVDVFQCNQILGTGIGDLKDEIARVYFKRYGPDRYVLYPHNQYLFILAGMGFIGLAICLYALATLFIGSIKKENDMVFLLLLIVSYGFLVDNVIERSFGVGFVVFLLIIGLRQAENKSKIIAVSDKPKLS